MGLIDRFTGWTQKDGKHYIAHAIPKAQTDWDYSEAPVVAYEGYVRVRLATMFLSEERAWFKEWHPAVHATVKLGFAGRDVELSRVASPPKNMLGPGVFKNYALSELMPYSGGDVEIYAGLLALKGADYLASAVGVLSSFAGLVAPPLATALELSQKVGEGMSTMFDAAGGQVHMSLHDSWGGGGKPLRAGYIAVVRATRADLTPEDLWVRNDQLFLQRGGALHEITAHDHMLLRIETPATRDDWRLPDVEHHMRLAGQAYRAGDLVRGDRHRAAATEAAWISDDLHGLDQVRAAKAICDYLAQWRMKPVVAGTEAVTVRPGEATLGQVMEAHAPSLEEARALGVTSLAELLSVS